MIFADVAAGASLFIDANTFVYHFMPHPTLGIACADLLARIQKGRSVCRHFDGRHAIEIRVVAGNRRQPKVLHDGHDQSGPQRGRVKPNCAKITGGVMVWA